MKSGLSGEETKKIVETISKTYADQKGINHIEGKNLPGRNEVVSILENLFEILFPGYLGETDITWGKIPYFVGEKVSGIYSCLTEQCTRELRYKCKLKVCRPLPIDECSRNASRAAKGLLKKIPEIREYLKGDVEASFHGDPASKSFDEIILSYPCIRAIATYRVAHVLYQQGFTLISRIMSENAHSKTGIDIHPGAKIGERFFIDHGTGVVVGETTVIGDDVKLYQGVTLGALSIPKDKKGRAVKGKKRHPTLRNGVTVYSNATILGGKTIIGKNAVVGGNVWLTQSVPSDSNVIVSKPELMISKKKK